QSGSTPMSAARSPRRAWCVSRVRVRVTRPSSCSGSVPSVATPPWWLFCWRPVRASRTRQSSSTTASLASTTLRPGRPTPINSSRAGVRSTPRCGYAYLEQQRQQVDQKMTKVADLLANDQLPDVRLRNGRLTITPLRTTVPPEAEELGRRAYELLRWVRITDLLVEVDEDDWHEPTLYPSANRPAGQGLSDALRRAAGGGHQPGSG